MRQKRLLVPRRDYQGVFHRFSGERLWQLLRDMRGVCSTVTYGVRPIQDIRLSGSGGAKDAPQSELSTYRGIPKALYAYTLARLFSPALT
jgi:hypothetical protein